jgi:hypothetical protein
VYYHESGTIFNFSPISIDIYFSDLNEQECIQVDNLPTSPPSSLMEKITQTPAQFLGEDLKEFLDPIKSKKDGRNPEMQFQVLIKFTVEVTRESIECECPNCHRDITTRVEWTWGAEAHFRACVLSLIW